MQRQKQITPVFKGTVIDGKLCVSEKDSFYQWISKFNGKKISVVISRWREKRTNAQNRFYRIYLSLISEELTGGETSPDWYHEYFKRIFLYTEEICLTLKEDKKINFVIPGSTTKLNTEQFSRYLMKIESETGIPIPTPKKLGFSESIFIRKLPVIKA